MKSFFLCVFFSLIICATMSSVSRAATQEKDIAQSGPTVLNATLAKKSVVVQFQTVQIKKADPGFLSALEQYDGVSVIRQMSISVDGQEVWVPRSVYADIFNARRVSIVNETSGYLLRIGCADGADSYSVHISFDATRVLSRSVYNTTNPPKLSEKTVYSKTEVIG